MNRKQNAIANRKYTKVVIKQIEQESLQSMRLRNRMKALELAEVMMRTNCVVREKAHRIYTETKFK